MAVCSPLHHLSVNQQLHTSSKNQRALRGHQSELVFQRTQVLEMELLNADNPQAFSRDAFKKCADPDAGPKLQNHQILRFNSSFFSLSLSKDLFHLLFKT